MNKQLKANLFLLIITMFWGSSFIIMKNELSNISPFNLISLRFAIAFVISGAFFYKRLININFKTIKNSLILGFILFLVFAFMTLGINFTSASNAGFIMGLTVVMIPILMVLLFKQNLDKKLILSVFISIIGISLLTLKDSLSFNSGDLLCIMSSLFAAFHIIFTGKLTKEVDSINLGIMQFGFVALFSFLVSLLFENPMLPQTSSSFISILLLSVFCTAIAFIVQTIAQQYTTPTSTGLIFSLEPVSSAFFAYMIAGEVLTTRGYIGAIILLSGIFLSEIDIKSFNRKKDSLNELTT